MARASNNQLEADYGPGHRTLRDISKISTDKDGPLGAVRDFETGAAFQEGRRVARPESLNMPRWKRLHLIATLFSVSKELIFIPSLR